MRKSQILVFKCQSFQTLQKDSQLVVPINDRWRMLHDITPAWCNAFVCRFTRFAWIQRQKGKPRWRWITGWTRYDKTTLNVNQYCIHCLRDTVDYVDDRDLWDSLPIWYQTPKFTIGIWVTPTNTLKLLIEGCWHRSLQFPLWINISKERLIF